MSSHDWFVEHRAAYFAGALDPEERRSFDDHLTRCDECRAELAALERELGWLPMGMEPVKPRPGFRWQIVRTVLGGARPSPWRTWAPIGVAAAALLTAGLVASAGSSERAWLERSLDDANVRLTALTDSLTVMRRAARVLQASIEMDGVQGGFLVFADSVTHRWNVVLHGMPEPEPGMTYRLWYVCSDGMVRGRDLTPVAGQPVIVTVGMPDRGGDVLGAALSVEPRSNQSDEPQGKELAHLML
ncbi:MAG: anti-sigma factor [Gemmatimonadales bacterium]